MKHVLSKRLMLSGVVLLALALVPAVAAEEDDIGSIYTEGIWEYGCSGYDLGGLPGALVRLSLSDRIPPEFYLIDTFYIYSAQYGVLADGSQRLDYDQFSDINFSWFIPVPWDGYTLITTNVYDSGGGLHSTSSLTADCTTGEIHLAVGSVYGPKVPPGFELRSLSGSSAVLDAPGGNPVGDNAVYAGQSWYINPTPEAGPDGKNYTEIYVNGRTTGYIPTECIGGVPSFSAE